MSIFLTVIALFVGFCLGVGVGLFACFAWLVGWALEAA